MTAFLTPFVAEADLESPYGGETAPNFAEVSVLEDRVRVVLEIDRSDFPAFVAPDDGTGAGLAARTGRTFRVQADGVPLTPKSSLVDLRSRKIRRTAATPSALPRPRSTEVIYAELDFAISDRPQSVTLIPPHDASGRPLVSLGVLVDHLGVPVTDYRYLSQRETMRLNWQDPWFTRFENPNLTRHHASPLMSFITVEPREVRHELILRLSDLEEWANLSELRHDVIGEVEMIDITLAAQTYLETSNPLTINGAAVTPNSIHVSRISAGADGIQVLPDTAQSLRHTTLLGVILSYPQPALAATVAMTWELFPNAVDTVPVTLTDPTGGVPAQARRDDPTVTWTNYLRTWQPKQTHQVAVDARKTVQAPVLSGVFLFAALGATAFALRGPRRGPMFAAAGIALTLSALASPVTSDLRFPTAPALTSETAVPVMAELIENAGVALLEQQHATFDAALSPFVAADAQADVGAEILRGLSVSLPSGARGRIEAVKNVTVEELGDPSDQGTYSVLAHWTATAKGGHWGHMHRREITYRALAEITPEDGAWMLSGLTVLRAKSDR